MIYGDGVIVNGHQDGTAFVVMLDRKSGEEIWRYSPAVNQRSFSTPVLTQFEGHDQLILTGSQQTLGLNPITGEMIWNVSGPTEKFICTPSAGHGMVFEPVSGKVLHTARALGATYSSPIAVGDRIYMFEDTGQCTIFENRPGFHVLEKNSLDEAVYTTPAVSNGQLFVRTTSALVCISESR